MGPTDTDTEGRAVAPALTHPTVLGAGAEPGDPTGPARPSRWARLWAAPLGAHAAALAAVLVALVPLIGTSASFSADEGAAIVQARHLARGDGWIVDHPLPPLGPGETGYPLELSLGGAKGIAPFAKHPLYAVLLAAADRVGGTTAMVALSLAGTVAAAALGAALAGHMRPSVSRPTLWAVGLASPLLFDGSLVIAHTLGAAFAAGATLLAVRAVEDGGRRWGASAGAAACLAVAVMLRNEAVLWALALGAVLGASALYRRSRPLAGMAAGAVAAAALAHAAEQAWIGRILGGHVENISGSGDAGLGMLPARVNAAVLTWLRPGYGDFPRAELALIVMLGAVVAAAVAVRRHPGDRRAISMLGGVAALAAAAALLAAPTNLVPGLLVACPVLAAGLTVLRRSSLTSLGARMALATFALFAMAVAATQYATGGSGEWGGRYFALGLPVILPVAVLALADAGARLDRGARRAALTVLVVCAAATSAMGVASIRDTHRFTARLMAGAAAAGRRLSPAERPVMVATSGAIPRLAWATFDDQRWLLSRPADLHALARRLAGGGTTDVVLVTNDLDRDVDGMGPGTEVVSRSGGGARHGWQVAVVHLAR